MKTVAWVITEDLSQHPWAEDGFQSWCGQNIIMVNQKVKVGVANNDKRAKCWCGTGKVGVATATPAIRHSPPMPTPFPVMGETLEVPLGSQTFMGASV